jgi:phosphate transport system permease protein
MPDYLLTTSPQMAKRHARHKRFQWYGRIAIAISISFMLFMFTAIFFRGIGAFQKTMVAVDVQFTESQIDPSGARDENALKLANYKPILLQGLQQVIPDVTERRDRNNLYKLLSNGAAFDLGARVANRPELIGTSQRVWVAASSEVDLYVKGKIDPEEIPEELRRLKDQDIAWVETLRASGQIKKKFNTAFFTNGDSRNPEMAGILSAAIGSFFSLLICFSIAFPLGILTAVYLEEYAKKTKLTDLIEVNINNLAAVPSIVFGLLGLAIFLNFFNLPRSTPLVGGMVLALMTLPTIIIASRSILRSVPQATRDAALGLGASKTQTTFHHVVPLAMPGMLTGTILGMARALGETAPLLMIGMVAFIVDVPKGVTDVATALPVQIFLWADSPEKGFVELTSAAIMVLLVFLILMNVFAVYLRKKLERRW